MITNNYGERIVHKERRVFHLVKILIAICLIPYLVGLFWLIFLITNKLEITNQNLVYKRFGYRVVYRLQDIKRTRVNRSILGRFLFYGKVELTMNDGKQISLPTIWRPSKFKNKLVDSKVENC